MSLTAVVYGIWRESALTPDRRPAAARCAAGYRSPGDADFAMGVVRCDGVCLDCSRSSLQNLVVVDDFSENR